MFLKLEESWKRPSQEMIWSLTIAFCWSILLMRLSYLSSRMKLKLTITPWTSYNKCLRTQRKELQRMLTDNSWRLTITKPKKTKKISTKTLCTSSSLTQPCSRRSVVRTLTRLETMMTTLSDSIPLKNSTRENFCKMLRIHPDLLMKKTTREAREYLTSKT